MKLVARNISVDAGKKSIVKGCNLSLNAGEMVGLIGPNGAGKSTLMRALAGVSEYAGEVHLDGVPMGQKTPRDRAQLLSFLPQDRQIEWAMSVREVVALGRHPFQRRFARLLAEDERAIDEAMAQLELTDIAGRSAKVLSGGEIARVLLARALAVEAPLLLADEPIAALDPFHQLQVMELLRAQARAGRGVLLVLHDLTLASRFLDRVIMMDDGQICCEGPPAEVLSAENLEQIYQVSPIMGEYGGENWLLPWSRKSAN